MKERLYFVIRGLSVFFGWAALCGSLCAADLPFPVGEELIYKITWNGIPVAQATAVTKKEFYEGREVVALQLHTQTFSFFDTFFKVDDFHETLIDPETFLPIRYVTRICEGSYRSHESTTFDFTTMKASYQHMISGKRKTYDIKSGMRDLVSYMYFMRSIHLKEDTKNQYMVMTDEKIYDLFITTFGSKLIGLPNYDKKIMSLETKPEASFDGLFIRNGKATVWISRDSRHLMTRAQLSVPFGRVSITLHEVKGPGKDFWITQKK